MLWAREEDQGPTVTSAGQWDPLPMMCKVSCPFPVSMVPSDGSITVTAVEQCTMSVDTKAGTIMQSDTDTLSQTHVTLKRLKHTLSVWTPGWARQLLQHTVQTKNSVGEPVPLAVWIHVAVS